MGHFEYSLFSIGYGFWFGLLLVGRMIGGRTGRIDEVCAYGQKFHDFDFKA